MRERPARSGALRAGVAARLDRGGAARRLRQRDGPLEGVEDGAPDERRRAARRQLQGRRPERLARHRALPLPRLPVRHQQRFPACVARGLAPGGGGGGGSRRVLPLAGEANNAEGRQREAVASGARGGTDERLGRFVRHALPEVRRPVQPPVLQLLHHLGVLSKARRAWSSSSDHKTARVGGAR